MNEIIREAIENKRMIEFNYKDEVRVVEPYAYGVSSKNNDILRGYQVEGGSSSSSDLGWRLFTVDKIENIIITDIEFEAIQDGYNPNDSAMTEIYVTV